MEAYIDKLQLNSGGTIELKKDDIVVFVGPNNAGKSKALSDIYDLCGKRGPMDYDNTIIVKDVSIISDKKSDLLKEASEYRWGRLEGNMVNINGNSINQKNIGREVKNNSFGLLRDVFMSYARAGDNNSANGSSFEMMGMGVNDPVWFLSNNHEYREYAAKAFYKAYGSQLIPHRLAGAFMPLCMGSEEEFRKSRNGKEGDEALDEYKKYLDSLPKVQDQSDGMRSFASTLVNLSLMYKQIYLLDEPETFLHPPQIRVMGEMMRDFLEKRQAFIATHSQDLINGLLSVDPGRVKIIRITREKDSNTFRILDNADIEKISKDPLLRYSDILNGLFHEKVIVCESDADCKMYGVVLSAIKGDNNKYSEALFIPSYGKQRIPSIVDSLKKMGIDVICILDIDLLSNVSDLKRTIEVFDGNWNDVERDYNIFCASIESNGSQLERRKIKEKILEIIDMKEEKFLKSEEIDKIKSMLKPVNKWKRLKESGQSAIPHGNGMSSFDNICKYLKEISIFLVREGELENFNRKVGGHGPKWVTECLEQYPDLGSSEYDSIREFVETWNV